MMLILLIIGLVTLLILYVRRNRGKLEHLGIPVVEPGFILGSEPLMMHKTNLQKEFLKNFLKFNTKTYGRYEGSTPVIATLEPEIIKAITVKHFEEFSEIFDFPIEDYQMTLDVAGGEMWRSLRKNLSATFTSGKLKQMLQPMQKISQTMIDQLNKSIKSNDIIDLKPIFQGMALDAIGKCGFGIDIDSYDPSNALVQQASKIAVSFDVSDLQENLFLQLMAHLPFLQKVFGTIVPAQYHDIHKITKEIIASRRAQSEKKGDFVSRLIDLIDRLKKEPEHEDMKVLNEDIIISQGVIFFFAGLETVSNELSTLAYELAMNPEIQQRLYEEIAENVDLKSGQIDPDILDKLEFTDAVIQENLRKNPAAIMHLRLCTKDCEVRPGMTIRKGTRVEFPIWAGHHHPDLFEDPEKFRPERFLKGAQAIQPFLFRPFGSGLRLCIGQRFALTEMRVSLAKLLLNFEIVAVDETELSFANGALFVLSFPSIKVKLVPRKK